MPDIARRPRLLTALGLALPLIAAAQAAAPPTNVPERALREAERVLSIIKFHAVRPSAPTKPRRPAASSAQPPKPPPALDRAAAPATLDGLASAAEAASSPRPDAPPADGVRAAATTASAITTPQSTASADTPSATQLASTAAAPVDEANEDDMADDAAGLQLRQYVEPVLPQSVQATLGAAPNRVWVRFTVGADGNVTRAEAAAGAPRRLARPATDAVLQWQFEPVPQARTAEVEIVFKRN